MKKIILSALVAMVLVACAKEEASIAKIEEVKNPYAVTTDEAVQLLQTVIGGESTRAISVGEIKTLRKSDFVPTTRGADDGDLIYIVDLENGGSAIMGADKRMEPIYVILDETKVSPEQLTLTATRSDDGEQDIEEYVMGLVNAKIGADANSFIIDPPFIKDSLPIPSLRPETWTVTTTLGQVSPMLRTKWGQDAPFNNVVDMNDGNSGVESLVGCSTIAIGQIMAFHQRNMNNTNYNWNIINSFDLGYELTATTGEITYMANYLYEIRAALSSEPLTNSGVSIPQQVVFMGLRLGYNNVSSIAYNLNNIYGMLDYGNPVCINGSSTYNNVQSNHTWLLDGYHSYKVEDWERTYIGEFVDEERLVATYYYDILHCNYGDRGVCDGYYSSGVFDLTVMRNSNEFDPSIGDRQGISPVNYSSNLYIIQYSK